MSIFNDMEVMRKVGLKYDLKTHGYPQSCAWGSQRMPNADEIRWNVYAYLSYGFKALSYFNYVMWNSEGCFNGLIDREGNIPNQELYDAVAEMNWDIRSTSDIIMNLDCLHAYHTSDNIPSKEGLSDVELLPENWIVSPKSDSDLIISYMKARDGSEPYLMIFNKSFENEVTDLEFNIRAASGITSLNEFRPSTKDHVSVGIENNTFKLSLKKGEGKFIRITGNVDVE